jgi:hypothetical protein
MVRYSEYVVARGECLLWQPPGSLLHLPRTPAASKLVTTLSGGKGQVMTDSDSFCRPLDGSRAARLPAWAVHGAADPGPGPFGLGSAAVPYMLRATIKE